MAKVLKAIAIPEHILEEITIKLQQSHKAENEYHTHEIAKLRKGEDLIQGKINRLLDLYLEKGILEDAHSKKNKALEQELIKNRVEREMHEGADEDFKNTLITAFKLANRASELFEGSKILEKRELINFVFSNLSLKGRKLEYTLRKPFDMLVEMSRSEAWLPRKDSNLRQSD